MHGWWTHIHRFNNLQSMEEQQLRKGYSGLLSVVEGERKAWKWWIRPPVTWRMVSKGTSMKRRVTGEKGTDAIREDKKEQWSTQPMAYRQSRLVWLLSMKQKKQGKALELSKWENRSELHELERRENPPKCSQELCEPRAAYWTCGWRWQGR